MKNRKVLGALVVALLAVVGYFYGPQVAKSVSDAVAPMVSDVVPAETAPADSHDHNH